jgi:hypothetical protein
LKIGEVNISSVRPEAQFLFRDIFRFGIKTSSRVSVEEIVHQVRVFQEIQTNPNFSVDLSFSLAQPEARQDSYSLAEILEPLKNLNTHLLVIKNGDQQANFFLGNLNAETFREFQNWRHSLEFFGLFNFKMNMVESEPFSCFSKLMWLCLVDLGLKKISSDAFKGLETSLHTLNLDVNMLEDLDNGIFDCLTNLEDLFLNMNMLKSLQPGLFQSLSKLKKLGLNRNPLSVELQEDTFCGLEHLNELDLSQTPLAEVIDHASPIIRKHMKNAVVKLVE